MPASQLGEFVKVKMPVVEMRDDTHGLDVVDFCSFSRGFNPT